MSLQEKPDESQHVLNLLSPHSGSDAGDPTWGFMPRLRRLTQMYTAAWVTYVSADVTSTQFGMLSALDTLPGQDQKTLAQNLSMDKSSTADVVNRLSRRGHIRALRDPDDSRRKILLLTPDGKASLEELRPLVHGLRSRVFAEFGEAERTEFLDGMSRLIHRLEGMTEQ
ncbi:MarR family winged helix-turn-helix transcriptional regulator [Specibacter cremeus]|uniref:MarR family winged helix-turn-helix transcriptional regulator n=1 Tax=Specibacter cremeus TaxID=1629051 RepID=UPI000F7A7D4D|nr:MarR family transcriptional regulator [Specibacter cremeus]